MNFFFFAKTAFSAPKAVSKKKTNKQKNESTKYIANLSSLAYKLILNLFHDPHFQIVLTLCRTSPRNEMEEKQYKLPFNEVTRGNKKQKLTFFFPHSTHVDLKL